MLIDRSGEIEDVWPLVPDTEPLPVQGYALVPMARLEEALQAHGLYLGLLISNDVGLGSIELHFNRLGLISVDFPGFADGRGFSLAATLRRAGFAGRLRASGPVIADQFGHLLTCGFDEVDVPDDIALRQPVDDWLRQLGRISFAYQRGLPGRASVIDRRHPIASKAG
ncbi:MAG: DUF934 domain-containing protein [Pseudomonadota bacterium]